VGIVLASYPSSNMIHEIWHNQDGNNPPRDEFPGLPFAELVANVASSMQSLRPDNVVLTFDQWLAGGGGPNNPPLARSLTAAELFPDPVRECIFCASPADNQWYFLIGCGVGDDTCLPCMKELYLRCTECQSFLQKGDVIHSDPTECHTHNWQEFSGWDDEEGMIRINIKTLAGKDIPLDVKPSYTIDNIKVEIAVKENIATYEQRLVMNGIELENGTVSGNNIQDGAEINLAYRGSGGGT
jgi:hypothetical protein